MRKISFSSLVTVFILAVFLFCGSVALKSKHDRKMREELKMEIQAVGLFACKQKTIEYVDASAGEVALMHTEGIRLVGDSTVYPVTNHLLLHFQPGDSVYVVNRLALSGIPTTDELRQALPPSEALVNLCFGLTAAVWIWFVTRCMLWYLQRKRRV